MKRATAFDDNEVDSAMERTNSDSSDDVTRSAAETDPVRPASSPDDNHAGDGSLVYRVAALIGMLILAITGFGLWFYFR